MDGKHTKDKHTKDKRGICSLSPDKPCTDCDECNMCDLDPAKICDNCCACLDTADYGGILIDGIACSRQKKKPSGN